MVMRLFGIPYSTQSCSWFSLQILQLQQPPQLQPQQTQLQQQPPQLQILQQQKVGY